MEERTFRVKTTDDMELFVRRFSSDAPNGQLIHIMHGMGDHSGRYKAFSLFLAEKGYVVYAHDHRHHGKSLKEEALLGIFDASDTFDTLVDDALRVQETIAHKENTDRIITLGHSMGSIVLRRMLQKEAPYVEKAIIMGTLPRYSKQFIYGMLLVLNVSSVFKKNKERHHFMAKVLHDKTNRSFTKAGEDKNAWISNDPEAVRRYNEDPLCGITYNKHFYATFLKGLLEVNRLENIARTKRVDTLFISGFEDPLNKRMKEIDKLCLTYQNVIDHFSASVVGINGARHEVLNEKNKEDTYQKIMEWLDT